MIKAIGLDIVEVARIEKAMERSGFLDRILTPKEQEHCRTAQQVAGRWAAKEAMFKCLPGLVSFSEIEILPDENGAPKVLRPDGCWLISISHDKGVAAAVAVLVHPDGALTMP